MTDVWLVTDGCYSDYRVVGVYSTRELAEEAQKLTGSDSIEAADMDRLPERPPGLYLWRVCMFRDGHVSYAGYADAFGVWRREYPQYNGPWNFMLWAADREHAIKTANERRVVLLAEGLWDRADSKWTQEQPLYKGVELVEP